MGTTGTALAREPEEDRGATRAAAPPPAMGANTPGPHRVEALERRVLVEVSLLAYQVALGCGEEAFA